MTDEYAARRREYVAQIRSSFDNGAEDVISNETEERTASAFSFGKLRFGAAMVFLFFFSGKLVYGRDNFRFFCHGNH